MKIHYSTTEPDPVPAATLLVPYFAVDLSPTSEPSLANVFNDGNLPLTADTRSR